MDGLGGHYASEINQTEKDKYWYHLHDMYSFWYTKNDITYTWNLKNIMN